MNFYQIERFVAFGLSALVIILIAVYVALVLPRVRPRLGVALTFAGAAALWAGSWAATDRVSVGLTVSSAALIAAHYGWAWGRMGARRLVGRASVRVKASRANAATPLTPAALDDDGTPWGPALASSAPPGGHHSTLGRYIIEREIGRGSMGAVYLAVDPHLGQSVALKTMALSQEFEGEALAEARNRFFREAQTAGRLRHPDIVTILDTGEDQDLAYIAMEYLTGQDLQAFSHQGRLLPVSTVLHIVARVADALAYAHSQGVVHRDIKPANVMVDMASDSIKVMDFGIAHVSDALRTRTGMVLGTPSFMSPEQLAGGRLDGRSDIYSLGVMLFQLLTGRLPHQAESMARVMYLIANEPAPDLRSLRSDLPEALANVVALALEKQPETRYADGHQLAVDLREVAARAELHHQPKKAPLAVVNPPQAAQDFTATVTFFRADTGHNPKV